MKLGGAFGRNSFQNRCCMLFTLILQLLSLLLLLWLLLMSLLLSLLSCLLLRLLPLLLLLLLAPLPTAASTVFPCFPMFLPGHPEPLQNALFDYDSIDIMLFCNQLPFLLTFPGFSLIFQNPSRTHDFGFL